MNDSQKPQNKTTSPNDGIRRAFGAIVEAIDPDVRAFFFVTNPKDFIQAYHMRGEFYEKEDLKIMSKYIMPETRYVDIGANIGNHIIYLTKSFGLKNVIAIEPNPVAMQILRVNIALNNLLSEVDLSLLGIGLSNESALAQIMIPKDNLGGSKMVKKEDGRLRLEIGDSILADKDVDFLKIDIEGMEIACLEGLSKTIERCRPHIFIEIDNENAKAFSKWCKDNRYSILERHRNYTVNENFMIVPEK